MRDFEPSPRPKQLSPVTATLLFWPVAIIGAAADLWSKWAVFNWLDIKQNECYVVIDGFLRIFPRENIGAAFSLLQGWTFFLVLISVAALLVVFGVFFFAKIQSKLILFAMGCMTAGIVGNLYDRLFNGGCVRDFIDVLIPVIKYPWPTFNIADSMLCVGVGLMIIKNLKPQKEDKTS